MLDKLLPCDMMPLSLGAGAASAYLKLHNTAGLQPILGAAMAGAITHAVIKLQSKDTNPMSDPCAALFGAAGGWAVIKFAPQ